MSSNIIVAPGLIQIVPVLPAPEPPAGTPITRQGLAALKSAIVLRRAAKADLLQAAPRDVAKAIRRMDAASEVIRTFEAIPEARADYAKATADVVRARSASEILAAIEAAKRASDRIRSAEELLREHGCIR